MKYTIVILLTIISLTANSQQYVAQHLTPPETYWQSFGYQRKVDHVQTVQYKSDSLGYEPTAIAVKSFNKEGFIIQDYMRVLGDFASETANNYVYKNGVLDSINTLNTNKDFNGTQKMHYDEKGRLIKITSTGKYTEYTNFFTYDDGGMVKTIQQKYEGDQSPLITSFDHRKNTVTEVYKKANGESTTTTYIYNGDELFATIYGNRIVRFKDPYYQYDFEIKVEGDVLQYVIEKRRLFQQDEKYLSKLLEEKNGKIVFDIPATVKNENGDIIRQLQLDKTNQPTRRRLFFSKYVYADGTESGSTDYDFLFGKKVEKMQ